MKKWQAMIASVACSSMLLASTQQVTAKEVIVPYELKHTTTTSQVMFHTDERFNDLNYNVVDGLIYKTYETVPVKAKTLYGIYNDKYQFKIKNGQLYYAVDGLYKKRFTGSFKVNAESESDDLEYGVYTYTFKLGKVVNFQRSTYINRFAKDAKFIVKAKKTTKTATGQYKNIVRYSDYAGVSNVTYTIKNGYLYNNYGELHKENNELAQKKSAPAKMSKQNVIYKAKDGRIYRAVFNVDEYIYSEGAEKRYKLYNGKLSLQHQIAQNYEHSVLKVKNGKVVEVTNTEYVVK